MREKFLFEMWDSYPRAPLNASHVGRVIEINEQFVRLEHGKSIQLNPASQLGPLRKKFASESVAPITVLVVGDIVALTDSLIYLLTPNFSSAHERPSQSITTLKKYSVFKDKICDFFHQQGFWQATTPGLVTCPGTEPYLDVFETEFQFGRSRKTFYLPTSPEIHLKKMLSLGSGPIFEIKNVFRNGENSSHHEPEFSILEWYRPYADHRAIAEDLKKLIQCLKMQDKSQEQINFESYSVQELFKKFLDFDLRPNTGQAELHDLARAKKLNPRDSDSVDDLFNLLFIELIEPKLNSENPTFVHSYPDYMAAYSRINQDGWADRFELYWQGLEIANAFHELNDPKVQLARMKADLEKRSRLGKKPIPIDQEFIQLLNYGMPPSGGIAVGVDRLFMACENIKDICELYPFSVKREI